MHVHTALELITVAARADNAQWRRWRSVKSDKRHDANIQHVSNDTIARGNELTEQPLLAHDLRTGNIRMGVDIVSIYRCKLTCTRRSIKLLLR